LAVENLVAAVKQWQIRQERSWFMWCGILFWIFNSYCAV